MDQEFHRGNKQILQQGSDGTALQIAALVMNSWTRALDAHQVFSLRDLARGGGGFSETVSKTNGNL